VSPGFPRLRVRRVEPGQAAGFEIRKLELDESTTVERMLVGDHDEGGLKVYGNESAGRPASVHKDLRLIVERFDHHHLTVNEWGVFIPIGRLVVAVWRLHRNIRADSSS
jgi:hypothetical protein